MLSLQEIKQKIEENLPGSKAEILDPRKDGKHLKAIVTHPDFKGKSLIEQHRMVLNAIKNDIGKDKIHAMSLETKSE